MYNLLLFFAIFISIIAVWSIGWISLSLWAYHKMATRLNQVIEESNEPERSVSS